MSGQQISPGFGRQQPIDGDGVRLRPFHPRDVTDLAAACTDPVTQRFIPGMPHPYTEETARWWVTDGAPAAWSGGGSAYAIVDPSTDRLLGGTGLSQVVPVRGQAEIGYWVAPWARGRGVATAATHALAAHAFATGTVRLELLTEQENIASQRVALATGFRYEGVRRSAAANRDGKRHDLLAWVRLADDPPGPTKRLLPDLPDGGLTDGVITLRLRAPEDADLMFALHSLPEVVINQAPPIPPTWDEIAERCRVAASRLLTGSGAALLVVDAASGAPVASCGLTYDDPHTGQATIGYAVLPEWRGRGIATRLVRLLARWAFDEVGVARLAAETLTGNTASQRVLEKVGFRREGLLRDRLPGLTRRVDEVVFGLLPAEMV